MFYIYIMKVLKKEVPLTLFLEMGGTLNSETVIARNDEKVKFVDFYEKGKWSTGVSGSIEDDHRAIIYTEKTELRGYDLDSNFTVLGDFYHMTKEDLKDVVTRAYNMGAFHHNAMAKSLHREIQSKGLEDFLSDEIG